MITQPTLFDNHTSSQLSRLKDLLNVRPVTCEDCKQLGIAGSALSRRIKDLIDKEHLPIVIDKKVITSTYSGKKVKISQYILQK